MKRIFAWILTAALLCAVLSGCGSAPADEAAPDVSALITEMQAAAELPAMKAVADADSNAQRGFSALSNLDYDTVAAYSLLYSADGSSYEIAVIRLKDAADMSALERSLQKHIEERVESYRYYKPEQVARASSAMVAVHGDYAALIMCDDNAAVKAVFDKAF